VSGRYVLDAHLDVMSGGSITGAQVIQNVATNVDDPQGMIALEMGLLCTAGSGSGSGAQNATFTVNGKTVCAQVTTSYDPGTTTKYPFLFYATPVTGTATIYASYFVQMTRFSADGPSTASVFAPGSITTSTRSLGFGTDPGPCFLDAWSRLATREGWYWRYTPQTFTGRPGTGIPVSPRTLGLVDFKPDPGSDLTQSCIFKRGENLLHLGLSGNADMLMSGTATASVPSLDGGGVSFFRDIATMAKYGVLEDQTQAYAAPDYNTLRCYSNKIVSNKIAVGIGGSKQAVLLRDPASADRWRELDHITIHDPEQNLNYLSARVLAYDFTEGDIRQNVILDQFAPED